MNDKFQGTMMLILLNTSKHYQKCTLSLDQDTVKTSRRFYGKYWQLAARAFYRKFVRGGLGEGGGGGWRGRLELLQELHLYHVLYVTYVVLHCPTMRNYCCK